MQVLGKAQILSAQDKKTATVPVPEWGGAVCVRSLTGRERDAYEAEMLDTPKEEKLVNLRARLVALCLCDETGAPLGFTADEVKQLGEKSAAALDRVFTMASQLNALGAADVAELEKN